MLQHNFPIILVKGEISNFIEATSGHWYFSLKDSNAQVRCTMFKGKNSRIKWKPKNGESIEAECKVGLYEARGEYQLNVESLQKSGLGDLFEEFNRLKEIQLICMNVEFLFMKLSHDLKLDTFKNF